MASRWASCGRALWSAVTPKAHLPLDVRDAYSSEAYLGLVTPQWNEWDEPLVPEGAWPEDLRGTYVRMGPIGFDSRSGERKRSLLDSAGGMIRAYRLDGRGARVSVRHVRTKAYEAERAAGRFLYPSLTTFARGRWNGLPRLQNTASVAAYPVEGRYLVMDEIQMPVGVSRDRLETTGEIVLDPEHPNAKYLAHAKRDPETGGRCFFALQPGPSTKGRVVCVDVHGQVLSRTPQFTIPAVSKGLGAPYFHDWALTERHVVIFLPPMVYDKKGLLAAVLGARPMFSALRARADVTAKIALIDRETGAVRTFDTGEPVIAWHVANAHDEGDDVVLDLVASRVDRSTEALPESVRLPLLGRPLPERPDATFLRRYVVGARGVEMRVVLEDANYEFPTVAPGMAGRANRFVFLGRSRGATAWFTGLAKHDYATGTTDRFDFQPHEFAGEPVFAPRARATAEDDGYVLVEVYDATKATNALLIFDARAIAAGPVATSRLGRHLPIGFHGLWHE